MKKYIWIVAMLFAAGITSCGNNGSGNIERSAEDGRPPESPDYQPYTGDMDSNRNNSGTGNNQGSISDMGTPNGTECDTANTR
jgi:hypothetical protein